MRYRSPFHGLSRRRLGHFGLALGLLLGLSACEGDPSAEAVIEAKLDSRLTQSQRRLLREDVRALVNRRIRASNDSLFVRVFGSSGVEGVLEYLDERIQLVLAGDSQITWTRNLPGRDGSPGVSFPGGSTQATTNGREEPTVQIAESLGNLLWILKLSSAPWVLEFQAPDRTLISARQRFGVVRLGPGYATYPLAGRLATWVHEARHEDCTGGLTSAEIQRYRENKDLGPGACGHRHSRCPKGHEYQNTFGCDSHPWGAFAIEAIFARQLVAHCDNCTRRERAAARAVALDAASRVLPEVMEQMIQGTLGEPDMTSQGFRPDPVASPGPEAVLEGEEGDLNS